MRKEDDRTRQLTDLRRRAQVLLSEPNDNTPKMSSEDIKTLVHELDTYQIELELQNEDLRHTQEELNSSLHRFSDLYDFAPVGYLTVSDKGLILEANLTATKMLGAERVTFLKQPLTAFIVDDDQDTLYRSRALLLETKEPQLCELRFQRKDGQVFYGQLKSVISTDMDGSLGQFRAVITDISKRKELERKLASKNHLNEILLNAFPCVAMLINHKSFEIVASNQAAKDAGAFPGATCFKTWGQRDTLCPGCLEPALRKTAKVQQAELLLHGKNWDTCWLPVTDDLFMHYAFDITQRRRSEEQLKQALKMQAVGTLAGGIAHEFNNLLGVIMGCADLAREEIPADSFAGKQLAKVMKASFRARDLVKKILTFSRKSHQQQAVFHFESLVKETIKLIETSLPTSVEVKLDIPSGSSSVFVDPAEIQQIILNISINAIYAMQEKGILSISVKMAHLSENGAVNALPAGKYAVLIIQDTGSGIKEEDLPRIFDPFFSTKEVGHGTGMGLSIVHSIMESYNGKIMVESEIGKGSTFRFYFPITNGLAAHGGVDILPQQKGCERILFVDDDLMYAEMGSEMLASLDYEVDLKVDSSEALEAFKDAPEKYDLVITDQIMPNLSGEDLIKEIRSIRPGIPIILCTGYSTQMDEKKAEALGVEFAFKPIAKAEIAKLIRKALDG